MYLKNLFCVFSVQNYMWNIEPVNILTIYLALSNSVLCRYLVPTYTTLKDNDAYDKFIFIMFFK